MGSSSSQHLKCRDGNLIAQLAKCYTNNAPSLGPSSCLVLDTSVCARILRCLPRYFADHDGGADSEFGLPAASSNGSSDEYARIVEIAVSKAENLELIHNDATIEGQLDLSRFHSLLRLRLKSVPIHLLFKLSERRDTLVMLDVDSCAASLMSVIELCAGDRISGANWPRLKHLRFSGCRLRHLDLSVRYLVSVTHLDLSYNQLMRVDELQQLKSLQSLNLSFNRLHRLPSLAACRSLRRLRLAYNFLENLNGIEELRRLELLDARNNVICHLALIGELRSLGRLNNLDLRGNPAASAADHRAQLLLLLHCREPSRLLLNGCRLNADEVRVLVHSMKSSPHSVSIDEHHQHQQQRQRVIRGSVNAGYSTTDEWSESPAASAATNRGTVVALVHATAVGIDDDDDADDDGPQPDDSFGPSARPLNFTNECEADVSSGEEPPTQQQLPGARKRGSAGQPTGGQNMREYLEGLRQRYGDGYIVRLNEQQQQQRQRQQMEEEQVREGEELRDVGGDSDGTAGRSPVPQAVSSTPLDPPPSKLLDCLIVPPKGFNTEDRWSSTAAYADRTPVMDSIGSDVLVMPPPLQPPAAVAASVADRPAAAGGTAATVEQELGLIRGDHYLAIQTDTDCSVMLSLAEHCLTIRQPNCDLSEELDLRRLLACELAPAPGADFASVLRLRFSGLAEQQLTRTYQLQEDDPAEVAKLVALLNPYAAAAAAVAVDRLRCVRCDHSFDAANVRRSILPCESAHSLTDIREAPVCPNCGSEFIVASAAAAPSTSVGPPAARFFVGSIGTDMSAPRATPPGSPPVSIVADQASSSAAPAAAPAFARTPSRTSLNAPLAAPTTASLLDSVDGGFDFENPEQAAVDEELNTCIGSPAGSSPSAAPTTDTDAFVTANADEPTADLPVAVAEESDQEVLPDGCLAFDPAKPRSIDHRLKLHLDLTLLTDGEEAAFAALLPGCQLLPRRSSDWEAVRQAGILVGTDKQLLLLSWSASPNSKSAEQVELSKCLAVVQRWPLSSLLAVQSGDLGGGLVLLCLSGDARILAPLGHRLKLEALTECLLGHCPSAGLGELAVSASQSGFCLVDPPDSQTSGVKLLLIDTDEESDGADMLRLLSLPAVEVADALADGRQPDWRLKASATVEAASLTALQSLSLPASTVPGQIGWPLRLEFFPEDGLASWSIVLPTAAGRRRLCERLAEPWRSQFGVELPVCRLADWGLGAQS